MASDGSVVIDISGNSKPFEESINKSIKSIQDKIDTLKKSVSELDNQYNSNGKNLSDFKGKLDSVKKSVNSLDNEFSTLNNSLNGIGAGISSASGSVGSLETNANQTKSSIQRLGSATTNANNGVLSLGQAFETANKNVLSLGSSSSTANSGIQQIGNASLTAKNNVQLLGSGALEAQGEFQSLGTNGTNAINSLAAAFAAAGLANVTKELLSALGDCVNTFASFESQMSTVQATAGASATEMQKLTEKAQEMGATTSFTAEQAGEALQYMAMAGWKTNEMLEGLDGVMNLAAASGEDLGAVSDILTDAITAFGDSASDAGRYADVLASAASNANTDVRGIGEACKYAAPVAGALGYSLEDVTLALGLMANNSVKSSMAGTSLRSILNSLSGTSKTANSAFEELNFSITNQNGKIKPLRQSLGELREKLRGLSETQQNQYAKSIAGTEAMSGFLAIVNSSDEDFNKLATAIDNSAGAAERMAEIKLDNLQGSLTLLSSAFDGLKLTIGSQLAPAIETVINAFTWLLNTANSLAETFPFVGAIIAGFTAEIATLAAAFASLTIIKLITPLVIAFNAACAANPYIQVALAVVAIGTAVVTLVAKFTDATDAANETATAMDNESSATNEATQSIYGFSQGCNTAEGAGRKVANGVKASEKAFNEFNRVSKSAVESLKNLEKEYDEAAEAAKESIESQNNLWDDLSDAIEEGGLNLKKSLESQVEYWRTFNKDVETLNGKHVKGLNEVVQKLVKGANEGSREAVNALHWMAQQNDYSLNQVIEKFSDLTLEQDRATGNSAATLTNYGNRVAEIFNGVSKSAEALDLSSDARKAGIHTMEGYIEGLNSKSGAVNSAMKNAAKNGFSAFTKTLDEHSPSKLYKKSGVWSMEGYEIGVESKSRDVSNTMQDTAKKLTKSFNDKLPGMDNNMMEKLNDLVSAGSASIRANIVDFSGKLMESTTSARSDTPSTVANDNGITVNVYCENKNDIPDTRSLARQLGREVNIEMRRKGILA